MNFGKQLIEFRKAFRMSQQVLAEKTGVSQSRISRLETNDSTADIKEISAFSKAFYITEGEFLDGKVTLALWRKSRNKGAESREAESVVAEN